MTQKQGNGNVNVSPAVSLGGDARPGTLRERQRGVRRRRQSNEAKQAQSSEQKQRCDASRRRSTPLRPSCADGLAVVDGGDQTVEKQSNDAEVTQKQGNENVNVSPALAFGKNVIER